MSRSITIGYRRQGDNRETQIEVRPPYYLLGGQTSSMQFGSIPKLKEIGITQLGLLGVCDPVSFHGWENIGDLDHEIHCCNRTWMASSLTPATRARMSAFVHMSGHEGEVSCQIRISEFGTDATILG